MLSSFASYEMRLQIRDRQLKELRDVVARQDATIGELADAIRDRISDGRHVGPRSERLRAALSKAEEIHSVAASVLPPDEAHIQATPGTI